jgi:hypothetical protein
MKLLVGIAALLLTTVTLRAQEKIQVVTKTINRSFALRADDVLVVQAEKADVRVKGWDRPEVKLVLRLVAKHPERPVAEADLPALRYEIDTEGTRKTIRNFFRINDGLGEINSNLLAQYELWVPQRCRLQLQNRYGNVRVTKLTANVSLRVELGEIHLREVRGTVALDVAYGDVIAERVNASLTGMAKKSDLTLEEMGGTVSLQSSYGEIKVTTANQLERLFIEASRTEVLFAATDPLRYHYQLTTTQDRIITTLPGTRTSGGLLGRDYSFTSTGSGPTNVIIRTSLSPITINFLTDEPFTPRTSSQ